jgi:hypothetical protein
MDRGDSPLSCDPKIMKIGPAVAEKNGSKGQKVIILSKQIPFLIITPYTAKCAACFFYIIIIL